ncbi:thermosome subunit [Halosimplex rubrum]|uniref:Thermosome subunit n=1 Tax=Halosimplex rubrum TaxID=869889 RepID=A0A7D5TNI9_9EURY|nr:thermosome subunit alpha [Halosimplex rubrum]QLH77334.1 thermosome subunit [Halosimplex rubrum]
MGGQPMFILNEDSERTQGKDAQSSNITAGKAVSESVRTTLGPRGMDKMLVSDGGDVVITNDGATILDEMDIEHPAAQMISEVAETQETEVGDGTTTAAVLAGELLSQAEDLLDDDVHPTTIVEGYYAALSMAHEAIDEIKLDEELDDDLLETVARSSMTGKGTGDVSAERLAETVVDAVRRVADDDGVVRDNITVYTQTGSSSSATRLVDGVLVDEEPVHDNMPTSFEDPQIAFVNDDIEVQEASIDAEYNVSSVDDLNTAIEAEESELRGYAEHVLDLGVDVLFVDGDVADQVAAILAKNGVAAFEVGDDEGDELAHATGLSRAAGVNELEADDLGSAGSISVEKFGDDYVTFVEDGAAGQSVTVFARGGTEHVTDELERVLGDALDVVTAALDKGGVVPGAGATEIAVADHIRSEAASVEGRKQLAVEAFADAVDVLPRTLAENTGMDPIDALVDLRAEYESEGIAGIISEGQTGVIDDPVELGVLDPVAVKDEAVESATEAATMIVRIDDVISAS